MNMILVHLNWLILANEYDFSAQTVTNLKKYMNNSILL